MREFHTAAVVGLGLIGGSLAMDIKKKTSLAVYGLDTDETTMQHALENGVVDGILERPAECDLIFVALYPGAAVSFVLEHLEQMAPDTVLVDLCGIKRYLDEQLAAACREKGIHYVGAHPMAGKETSGLSAAVATLYDGASLILTPCQGIQSPILEAVERLAKQLGFAQVVYTTPEQHDRMIAYTSQLAHVLSSSYIQNPLARDFSGFTGGSFQDLTRVSRLNAEMWGELFFRNKDMLCEQLDRLIGKLCEYKFALETEDSTRLFSLMERGTDIKNKLLAQQKDLLEE